MKATEACSEKKVTAIIADDEQELRRYLITLLTDVWPSLHISGEAENGVRTVALVEKHQPDIVFLDIRMPGLSGIEAANAIATHSHIVFVTAYDEYAVIAFEKHAVDYLLKPVTRERLLKTVSRLKKLIQNHSEPSSHAAGLAQVIIDQIAVKATPKYLQWINVQIRNEVRLIPVSEVIYFNADDKYTTVYTQNTESLIRKSIRELTEELDPHFFRQIHRSTIVNLSAIESVGRSLTGRGVIRLGRRNETLTVSRKYLHVFRQM